jgi:S1-C subfamily serine protease
VSDRLSFEPLTGPPRRTSFLALSQTLVLVMLIIVLVRQWWVGAHQPAPLPPPDPVVPAGNLADDEKSNIQLFRQTSQSVANITTSALSRDNFSLNVSEIPKGTGTGFVWDANGHIVTNSHVVDEGNAWKVTLADQSTWDAEVVGVAPDRDIAVLKIAADRSRLRPLLVGTSTNLEVGQKVFAIGFPFGLDQTLTTGIISGLGREMRSRTNRLIEGVIQTDAAINPGNSGGPLLNSSGELIGVNTAIYSPSGASAGIGFAIPVDSLKRAVPQLISEGRITRPGIGVRVAEESITRRLGIDGVLIVSVVAGGPAAEAGLQPTTRERSGDVQLGDVITKVNGKAVANSDQLFSRLESFNVGDTVTLTVLRGARTSSQQALEVNVKLIALQ